MTANDELWSVIRWPTCVLSKILLPRIENSLLSPQEAAKELPRGRRCKTTVNPKDDEPTGESAYLVTGKSSSHPDTDELHVHNPQLLHNAC